MPLFKTVDVLILEKIVWLLSIAKVSEKIEILDGKPEVCGTALE